MISNLGVDKFITFLCLILDPNSNKIEIINAGHMAPLWKANTKNILEPGDEQAGVPIGVIDDYEYEISHIEIQPGEQLLLYTDGINEAPDKEGNMFGIARIQELMMAAGSDVKHIGNQVVQDLKQFVLGTEQADDMCLVVIGRV